VTQLKGAIPEEIQTREVISFLWVDVTCIAIWFNGIAQLVLDGLLELTALISPVAKLVNAELGENNTLYPCLEQVGAEDV